MSNASNLILVHNHPSGKLTPSKDDRLITERMAAACEILGIPLMDHIIVGGDNKGYYSFREKEILPIEKEKVKKEYDRINKDSSFVAEGSKKKRVHR